MLNSSSAAITASNFDKSWAFYNQIMSSNANLADTNHGGGGELLTVNNPNKALVVINGRTTEILTANDISCDLFGINETELIGLKLKDLLDMNEGGAVGEQPRKAALIETDKLDAHGRVVLCSGKIFDAYCCCDSLNDPAEQAAASNEDKLKIPVSIYMLKLTDEQEPRCLCVMEPIQRIVGTFTINFKVSARLKLHFFKY
jgi:PAS domain-containing protein